MHQNVRMAALVAPLLALFSLAGTAAIAEGTLERIEADKFIRLGLRVDTPPFAYLDEGKPAGFTVELCQKIVGAIMVTSRIEELNGEFIPVDAERRFDALKEGEIDLLCGATTATLTRRESVSFSIPTFLTGVSAIVSQSASETVKSALLPEAAADLSGSSIVAALSGKTIGVRAGTTAFDWISNGPLSEAEDLTVREFDNHGAGAAAVAGNEIDAYFADRIILQALMQNSESGTSLQLTPVTFTTEPYALALRLGDEEMRLLVDRALSFLYRNGEVFEIYTRHFGEPPAEARLFYHSVALPE